MAFRILLFLISFIITVPVNSQVILESQYTGEFRHGNFSTNLTIDIAKQKGSDQVFFTSPEQNAFRIPAKATVIDSDSIAFVLQSDFFRYEFEGAFKGQDSLHMNLTIDSSDYPFTLFKITGTEENAIRSRDIRFRSGNLLLYGTLYLPEKPNGKAIYLVTSSGDQDRSASRQEALFFADNGYIALHTDKRGTGMSDGNWQEASIPELCEDDIKAITYLSESNSINFNNIGIKGSSQGATKVPYILSEIPELGFGIVVSCPASTLLESDLNYWKNRTRNELSVDELNHAEKIQRSVFEFIAGDLTRKELEFQLEPVRKESFMDHVWVPELDSVHIDRKLSYSPMPYYDHATMPLLIIQGSSDEIIPRHSLETIREHTEKFNLANMYLLLNKADHSMMFQGESDFPYWPGLHPKYKSEMLKWLDSLYFKGN